MRTQNKIFNCNLHMVKIRDNDLLVHILVHVCLHLSDPTTCLFPSSGLHHLYVLECTVLVQELGEVVVGYSLWEGSWGKGSLRVAFRAPLEKAVDLRLDKALVY